ncbi:MAG: hypothetical protein V3T08_09385 [Gemmatimonadota bacterium]
MADKKQGVRKPREWDKAVSVAYLRLRTESQEDAAKEAGVGLRTVRRWEKSDWWPQACLEACSRWLQGLVYVSQQTLFSAIATGDAKGDANLALKVVERRIPELAPPKIAHELFGKGGGAIEVTSVQHDVSSADDEDDDE